MRASRPAVSIVVPTRDRPASLAACLESLSSQSIADLEVVVVDDASLEPRRVAAVVAAMPRARLVVGSGSGPAAARNLGAASAVGRVLCFTDDDCRPHPSWVAALLRRVEGGAEAVAGPTLNGGSARGCAAAAQTITNHLMDASLDSRRGTVAFGPTSNLACRAELCQRLPFDEGYPLAAGEDRDWCARLATCGTDLAFEPSAIVVHHPDLTLGRFWRQQLRYGRGARRFRQSTATDERPALPVRFYVDLLRKGFRQGPMTGALVLLAQVATAAGIMAEAMREDELG